LGDVFKLPPDSVKKQVKAFDEQLIRKKTKQSYVLGIVTLISTILFILWIFTVPTAIICGILAIIKGRKAIELMGSDADLKNKYYAKARRGIRLGMSFFYFLITLLFIGFLIGVMFGALYIDIMLTIGYHFDYGVIVAIVAGLIGVTGVVRLYAYVIEKVHDKMIPPKFSGN
jgi:hypothetical protein